MTHPEFAVAHEIGWQAFGLMRVLAFVHALRDDVVSALQFGQIEVAAMAARELIEECLGIDGMRFGGPFEWMPESVAFDPYGHCSPDMQKAADAFIVVILAAVNDDLELDDALDALEHLIRLVEIRFVATGESLPQLRDPDGMYKAISLGRDLLTLAEVHAVGRILPKEWMGEN